MDLTVAAVPFFFGSMEAERRWLLARADDPTFGPAQYERRDTIVNLTMGTASLFAPLVTAKVARHLEWGRGRAAAPMAAAGATAAAVTAVADRVVRRLERRGRQGSRAHAVAEAVAKVGSVSAVTSLGLVATSTWSTKLSGNRLWKHRRFDLSRSAVGTAAAIAGWDFIYYWNHRIMHETRFMWAIHVVHHSSERYNLSTALRQTVADGLGIFVPMGLMCLFGISPAQIETARGINLIYQYWIHTETVPQLGWFERVFNTASHHRVHHGRNRQYLDRNHGSILIVWDRLFGTFEPEAERVVYGLTTNLDKTLKQRFYRIQMP